MRFGGLRCRRDAGATLVHVLCFLSLVPAISAQEPAPAGGPQASTAEFNVDMLDRRIDPCTDFYAYACDKWEAQNPIPSDQSSWGRFDEAADRVESTIRGMLEKHSSADPHRSPLEQKLGDYYDACMDEDAVERAGMGPVQPELQAIDAIRTKDDLPALAGRLHRQGVNVLFRFGPVRDFMDASQVIAQIEAGGTAIADRDFYLRRDRAAAEFRGKYLKHMQKMFELSGDSGRQASAEAKAALGVETGLAEATRERTNGGEPMTTYRKMTMAELEALSPDFRWKAYFEALGWREAGQVVQVSKPQFFQQMDALLQSAPLEDVKSYLRWQVVHAWAGLLPAGFAEENFNFFEKTLSGTRKLPPRWKRCVRLTIDNLGDAAGQMYVASTFRPADKAGVRAMVTGIEKALSEDIDSVLWMGPETRRQARQKLVAVRSRIGYPDSWRDYGGLRITRDDLLGNSQRVAEFAFQHRLEKIGKPADPDEWPYPPSTVDASYNDQENAITLPAGILQAPFYDRSGDEGFNYGAIGGLIGHELTHGFDDEGSQYDANGNLRNWWSEVDRKTFRGRTQCFVDQYSGYTAVDKVRVDGKRTLAENIADNGGVRIAYAALMARLAGEGSASADEPAGGLTAPQRFFLGWANLWCQNRTAALSRDLAENATHSPGKWRVNGVLSNMPEFRQAFHCKADAPMVREDACRAW